MWLVGATTFGQDVPPAFEQTGEGSSGEMQSGDDETGYDPFDPSVAAEKVLRVQVEYVEVPHKDLTRLLMDEKTESSDATALRMKAQTLVDQDTAEIIDTQIVTGRSGQRSESISHKEFIYPTEYELPDNGTLKKELEKPGAQAMIFGQPTAFESRNIGSTLQSEPTLGVPENIIDLRFLSEFSWHTGNTIWHERKDSSGNVQKIAMPDFFVINISTCFTCIDGQYTMIGVLSPRNSKGELDAGRKVMVFVKCDVLPAIP